MNAINFEFFFDSQKETYTPEKKFLITTTVLSDLIFYFNYDSIDLNYICIGITNSRIQQAIKNYKSFQMDIRLLFIIRRSSSRKLFKNFYLTVNTFTYIVRWLYTIHYNETMWVKWKSSKFINPLPKHVFINKKIKKFPDFLWHVEKLFYNSLSTLVV